MLVFWVLFNIAVLGLLALDLGIWSKNAHVLNFKEAILRSAIWISLALIFGGVVYLWRGPQPALEFITGYIIEESLSVDNLFVFLLLFSYFKVAGHHQYKVLFWGIIGALVMRAAFIMGGVAMINRFHWVIYIFGALLIYSGLKLLAGSDISVNPDKQWVLKLFRRWAPCTDDFEGDRFFVRQQGRWLTTPLFAVLIVVETTDLVFATDSIPAILAISRDPFIVYTSNVFAILGLRSLYFALAGLMEVFHYLNYGLSAILIFIGTKMLLSGEKSQLFGYSLDYKIPIGVSLSVVATLLALSIAASLLFPKPKPASLSVGQGGE